MCDTQMHPVAGANTDELNNKVLRNVQNDDRRRRYKGIIHGDKEYARTATLLLMDGGNALKIAIPRLVLFPVIIWWYRKVN